jgi:hypothetical protein
MKWMIALLLLSPSAFAFQDGTYSCKNSNPEIPNNTYRVESVTLGGIRLPVLDIRRYLKKGEAIETLVIQGIGMVSGASETTYTIRLGTIGMEFENGEFTNCKK